MRVVVGLGFSRQPFRFICADEVSFDPIVFITEALSVEVYVLLEMLTTGEAAVKHLIRFIRALGELINERRVSVIHSVPGQHTHHILTSAS